MDQKNFRNAAEEVRKAHYYQTYDKQSERLNTEELGLLFGIHDQLKRHWQEHRAKPTPTEPAAPVLHGQHAEYLAPFPDLMSFDEDVTKDQDFPPGV